MYYVYILRCGDNSLYTGWSTDVDRRFKEHLSGVGSKYTRSRLPVELVYSEQLKSKSEAMKIECEIKRLSKKSKEELIKSIG